MFKLTRPCKTCPFLVANGRNFGLPLERLLEIIHAPAFQCHSTVDYDAWEDGGDRAGDKPQQCAGLMMLLFRAGRSNTIMQVAERTGYWDPNKMDDTGVFSTLENAVMAHTGMEREEVRAALSQLHRARSMQQCEHDSEED